MVHLKHFFPLLMISAVGAQAQGFSGWQATAGVDFGSNRLKGGEYSTLSTGADAGYAASDGKHSSTGLRLGLGYGFDLGNFLTTVGVDYSNSNNHINNSVITGTSMGPNGIHIKDRFDLYVAPGYKINPESLAYVKLAYSQVSKDGLIDTSSGASIGTGPKSSGISYGIGFKQKFGPQSPYFYAVDYSFGGLGKGTILSPSGNDGYNSKLNFSSLSINIGKTF
jgi:hypothetical protein